MKWVLLAPPEIPLLTHPQVLSGLVPYHHLRSPVVFAILRGERPGQPPNPSSLGLTDTLWGLLQLCWSETTSARPTALQLLDYLRPASLTWVPPEFYPTAGGVGGTPSSDIFPSLSGSPD